MTTQAAETSTEDAESPSDSNDHAVKGRAATQAEEVVEGSGAGTAVKASDRVVDLPRLRPRKGDLP